MKAEYSVIGTIYYTGTAPCRCCGQPTDKAMQKKVDVVVVADDETEAVEFARTKAAEDILKKSPFAEDIEFSDEDPPEVELIREISEAEILRELGAPLLPGMDV